MDRQGGHIMTTFMTVFITIISGVLVFTIGRFIEKLLIDPIKEHKTVIAEIYDGLIYHADKISYPLEEKFQDTDADTLKYYQEASNELRKMSTKLRAATFNLQGAYWFYNLVFRAPTQKDIFEVCRKLIGLSDGLTCKKGEGVDNAKMNNDNVTLIMKKLKLTKIESEIQK